MLRMTHFTRECCGAGQDQLAYSLQFTALSALLGDITARAVDDSTSIIVPPRMTWQSVGALDSTTRRPTLRRGHTFTPPVFGADTLRLLDAPPRRAVYVGLPNGDVERGLALLRQWYDVGRPTVARRGGYSMPFYRLALRASPP
jgi:hypothetical protein